jgi:hypothetical protein
MNWESIVQCSNLALGIFLIVRLFSIRLYKTYKLFCVFLAADLLGSVLWALNEVFRVISYRSYLSAWLVIRPVVWLFTLLTIYSLLEKILVQLPGLLRLSKRILNLVFLAALLIGFMSAHFEYAGPGFKNYLGVKFLFQCWRVELVFDRVIATAALLSLVAILSFLRWFPVTVPRNLAVLSVGFAAYFVAMTVLLLFRSLWPNESVQKFHTILLTVSTLLGAASGACIAFWIFGLSSVGETVISHMAIERPREEQEQLIAQLELINDVLVKATHH